MLLQLLVVAAGIAAPGVGAACVSGDAMSSNENGLELMLVADSVSVSRQKGSHVLVELRNISTGPLLVPNVGWIDRNLEAELVDIRGGSPGTGKTYVHAEMGILVLPPGLAIHLHLFPGHTVPVPSDPDGDALRLSVSLSLERGWSEGLTSSTVEGAKEWSGVVAASPIILYLAQEPIDVERGKVPSDLAEARRFASDVNRRIIQGRRRELLREGAASGTLSDGMMGRLAELDSEALTVEEGEILAFCAAAGDNELKDDVWFRFALSPAWDEEASVREALIERLMSEYPASTGYRQALEYLQWPDGYSSAVSWW